MIHGAGPNMATDFDTSVGQFFRCFRGVFLHPEGIKVKQGAYISARNPEVTNYDL